VFVWARVGGWVGGGGEADREGGGEEADGGGGGAEETARGSVFTTQALESIRKHKRANSVGQQKMKTISFRGREGGWGVDNSLAPPAHLAHCTRPWTHKNKVRTPRGCDGLWEVAEVLPAQGNNRTAR
jgi:hypothetical protein